jgi:hypothetical protein
MVLKFALRTALGCSMCIACKPAAGNVGVTWVPMSLGLPTAILVYVRPELCRKSIAPRRAGIIDGGVNTWRS